jgi:diacylglycerol kinase
MIIKCIKSFRYAFNGWKLVIKNENNAKVHLVATVSVIGCGICFNINSAEWLWIALAIALVWMTELLNSAIEKCVDFVSPNYNAQAGAIKDLAAGAVLVAALFAMVVGIFIFTRYI